MRTAEQTCQRQADRRIRKYGELLNTDVKVPASKPDAEYSAKSLPADYLLLNGIFRYYIE